MSYSAIHIHTDGSLLDGAISIDRYIKKAKELNMKAISITDHGSMTKVFEFYKKCNANNIKPILGCEFYLGEKDSKSTFHLVLMAKNNVGLVNLFKLSKLAYDNFYSKPRITWDNLVNHSDGVICSTACLGGELARNYDTQVEYTKDLLERLIGLFKEDLYLEVQPNSIPRQIEFNNYIKDLCSEGRFKPVLGIDAHFVNIDEYESHDTMMCMQYKNKKNDTSRRKFPVKDAYILSVDEIISKLYYLGIDFIKQLLDNTNEIADKCDVTIETGRQLLPYIEPKEGEVEDVKKRLGIACNEGLIKRHSEGHYNGMSLDTVIERIRYELDVICNKGYAGYFLIVKDYMDKGREMGIPFGVGRGSVGGSEIAFILGISEIEPIKYGLLFERFLNPTRDTQPDVDTDIDYELRDKLITYIKDKYGAENVCQINTEGKMTVKSVVRKVLSVYGYETSVINSITKVIPDNCDSLDEVLSYPEFSFKSIGEQELKDMKMLENLMSHEGKHAAGIVISPVPVDTIVPIRIDRETGMMVSQWHKKIIEEIGAYKFDLLGLKQITIFRKTLDYIKRNHGVEITMNELYHIDYNDPGIYEVLNSGNTKYVFQLDGDSASQVISKMKPNCFDDIMVAESICRPGVKEANDYLENKKQFRELGYFDKPDYYDFIKEVVDETYGCIVYQEQTMKLFHMSGNFTLGEADSLRKVKSLEPYKERFVTGWVAKGMTDIQATALFYRFSLEYSFNKSHACAYAIVSVICAWLKHYYPNEYISCAMTIELLASKPDINSGIKECIKNDVKILLPDINKANNDFNPSKDGIMFPITSIPFVGDTAYEEIINNRSYLSFYDFIDRVPKSKVNKRIVENLIKGGAFDCFNKNRSQMLSDFYSRRKLKAPQIPYWCDEVLMKYEKDIYGFNLTKHPLDGFTNKDISDFSDGTEIMMCCVVNEFREIKDKNGNKMCFLKLENKICSFDGVIFSYAYSDNLKPLLQIGSQIVIKGTKDNNNIKIRTIQQL